MTKKTPEPSTRQVPLDPLAAFFRRKAEFMEREAVTLALQLRGDTPVEPEKDDK